MDSQNVQFQQNVVNNGMNQKVKKGKVFGIIALVIGILSLSLCCLAGSVFGVIGIVLGIVSLCKEDAKGMAIGGIITSVLGFVIGTVILVFYLIGYQAVDTYLEGDVFSNTIFEGADGSTLYFADDASFVWYLDDSNMDDNYFAGTYAAFRGEMAEAFLTEDLAEFGFTADEMADFLGRNADSDFYTEENFTLLVMYNEDVRVDGKTYEESVSYYMGFYDDGYFDAANMMTGNYAAFTLVETDWIDE